MLPVIGFFKTFFDNFALLFKFVTTPIKDMVTGLEAVPIIGDMSIMGLLGVGLFTFLGALLVVHFIRLFVGG